MVIANRITVPAGVQRQQQSPDSVNSNLRLAARMFEFLTVLPKPTGICETVNLISVASVRIQHVPGNL